ncbi:MAG: flagellar assembly protein FliH [Candidatus Accumulibacter sp.]|uniref:Flagellar assembly protein FliH n=1 Tax=Candidatus Accumulibacter affinis TaxID=2954384 RepID=A0A935TEC6_9PROT|nr:flagellar assembly protein FliH [Candidatus Accumulibacter affinis]
MNSWTPKDKLTAYQRWQVGTFDEEQGLARRPATAAATVPLERAGEEEQTLPEPVAVLPSAEEVDAIRRQAQASGHAAGHAAGYAEGIAATQTEAMAIATLLDKLHQALTVIDQGVAEQLLALAIEIANQVVRQSLRVQPELLLSVVREALSTLHPHHGQPLLFVHPDDAVLVRKHLGEQLAHASWRVIDDSTLTVGGCRVELGTSEVDATLETRWRRVIEAIGVSQEWLRSLPATRS